MIKIKNKGFTLIEVLITITIVGIITAIATPLYTDHIIRSQASEGVLALSDFRVKLEQHFQDNNTYEGACGSSGLAKIPTDLKYFTITCEELTQDGYLLKAQSKDFTYLVDELNNKETTVAPKNWATSDSCWITSKGGQCR